jgi:hypothetical protein
LRLFIDRFVRENDGIARYKHSCSLTDKGARRGFAAIVANGRSWRSISGFNFFAPIVACRTTRKIDSIQQPTKTCKDQAMIARKSIALALIASGLIAAALPAQAEAGWWHRRRVATAYSMPSVPVVVGSPVVVASPVIMPSVVVGRPVYSAPFVVNRPVYSAPIVTSYAPYAPAVVAPTTTYYAPAAAPVVPATTTYYAPAAVAAPVTTYYAPAPVYTPAPTFILP